MSNCRGLFYAKRLRNCVHCKSILIFFCCCFWRMLLLFLFSCFFLSFFLSFFFFFFFFFAHGPIRCEEFLNISIWPIDRNLTSTTTTSQVFHSSKSSRSVASPSNVIIPRTPFRRSITIWRGYSQPILSPTEKAVESLKLSPLVCFIKISIKILALSGSLKPTSNVRRQTQNYFSHKASTGDTQIQRSLILLSAILSDLFDFTGHNALPLRPWSRHYSPS